MNTLEKTILDQHARIKSAGYNGAEILAETQAEIMEVATPEMTWEIINEHDRTHSKKECHSINAILRAQQDPKSILNRSIDQIRIGHGLARIDFILETQGYVGGLIFDADDVIVHGSSMSFRVSTEDPIQDAMGETYYPPMMWAKALRAEAYKNRHDQELSLSISDYLAEHGFSLGSAATIYGDLVGSTGFMPGTRMYGVMDDPMIKEHVLSEEIEAFRLSGLCDQSVVDHDVLSDTDEFARRIIEAGGSLN